jgi:hypothetical protein
MDNVQTLQRMETAIDHCESIGCLETARAMRRVQKELVRLGFDNQPDSFLSAPMYYTRFYAH